MDNMDKSSNKMTRLSRVSNLRGPGTESNFLDWEFKMELALENLNLLSVLQPMAIKGRPLTWARANTRACTLISWAVDDINIQHIKPFKRDAAGMWLSLRQAHKDQTLGGWLHLLQQLITMRMESDDVETHIQLMHWNEKLDSLVDASNPLTPDDIFTSALINLLPDDWAHVVTPLMQRPTVYSSTVIRAIQAESTRRKSSSTTAATRDASAARASKTSHHCRQDRPSRPSHLSSNSKHSSSNDNRPRGSKLCSFCKRTNHTVDYCWELDEFVKERDEKERSKEKRSKSSAKAGKTTVVLLDLSDTDSTSSDNSPTVRAKLATDAVAKSASVSNAWNVDSGCSLVMTPNSDNVYRRQASKSLADGSCIKASHSGLSCLPLAGVDSILSLLVPELQEPPLSVSALCDKDVTVVFTKYRREILP